MPAIAAAAGVSRATVFNSVGSKAVVLKASYDVAVVGDGAPVPIFQRPEMKAMFAEPDPRRTLELYAEIIAGIGERISGLYEVCRAAAEADPAIARLWDRIQAARPGRAPDSGHSRPTTDGTLTATSASTRGGEDT